MGPTVQFVRAFLFGALVAAAISVRFLLPDGGKALKGHKRKRRIAEIWFQIVNAGTATVDKGPYLR
jgi:hypothetical protein